MPSKTGVLYKIFRVLYLASLTETRNLELSGFKKNIIWFMFFSHPFLIGSPPPSLDGGQFYLYNDNILHILYVHITGVKLLLRTSRYQHLQSTKKTKKKTETLLSFYGAQQQGFP